MASRIKWSNKITTSQVEQLIRAEMDVQRAMLIFDSATAEYSNGFRHDQKIFGLIISKLVSANQFWTAETSSENERRAVGYGRVHRQLDSLRVFQRMKCFQCKPSPKSYVTILDILVEENQLKLALRFYKHMRAIGVSPTVASLNVLIKALCKNSGTMDSALQIFYEMTNRGYIPDSYTYGTLINGLCKWGKIGDTRKLFEEMETKVVVLLKRWSFLDMMVRKWLRPNMITYSTSIHGLCKEGKAYEALETLDRMKLQALKPDAGLWQDHCRLLRQEGANSLDEMILEGICPNRLTWSIHVRIHNAVVQGLASHGEINRAYQLYLSMRARGISVDASTFSTLVR
ncbi:hypothetical protein EUGRSUZ_E03144 [Eucalyptus grandis]|uniref:Uncharacterized protein n=2 Tax=Eucalyptus grandis TaxID=71139 RepID=A0ACC3KZ78_EUCGR|nr:hypothetical protein EUGRSUZ_E03144 [Eucalyptus grandis]